MFFKVQDIINIRTAELIDRLVIITNDTQVLILSGKNTDQIENVSATTEELAAGMEETAASSEEMNAMSHEIESAAKSIAERSQDGANEADEIRERAVKIKKDTDADLSAGWNGSEDGLDE